MKNGLCQVGTNGCEACLEFLPVDVYRQVSHENVDVCVRPMRVLRNIICKDPSVCRLILCDAIRKLPEGDAEEGDEARGRLIVELERRCQPLTKEKTESVLAEMLLAEAVLAETANPAGPGLSTLSTLLSLLSLLSLFFFCFEQLKRNLNCDS